MLNVEAAADKKKLIKSTRFRSVLICFVLFACASAFLVGTVSYSAVNGVEQTGNARKLLQAEEKPKKEKKVKEEKVKKSDQKKQQEQHQASLCDNPNYANVTLTLVKEAHFDHLFPNTQKKMFEGSDVIQVDNDYYVVFDNLYDIGRVNAHNLSSGENFLLPPTRPGKSTGSSGYEAIAYDELKKQFYTVVESEPGATKKIFHGVVEQMQMGGSLSVANLVQRCPSEFIFSSENKGFEGAAIVRAKNRMYMIGLCEGNFCMGGNKGKEVGNGRLIVMQKRLATPTTPCAWRTVREIPLSPLVAFQDYSALALRHTAVENQFDIAITSQENSQLWLGRLTLGSKLDLSDSVITSGSVYNFPRDEYCNLLFCSVEGIAFLDDNKFVAVSDVGGGTASGCAIHDESIHIFQLP